MKTDHQKLVEAVDRNRGKAIINKNRRAAKTTRFEAPTEAEVEQIRAMSRQRKGKP